MVQCGKNVALPQSFAKLQNYPKMAFRISLCGKTILQLVEKQEENLKKSGFSKIFQKNLIGKYVSSFKNAGKIHECRLISRNVKSVFESAKYNYVMRNRHF